MSKSKLPVPKLEAFDVNASDFSDDDQEITQKVSKHKHHNKKSSSAGSSRSNSSKSSAKSSRHSSPRSSAKSSAQNSVKGSSDSEYSGDYSTSSYEEEEQAQMIEDHISKHDRILILKSLTTAQIVLLLTKKGVKPRSSKRADVIKAAANLEKTSKGLIALMLSGLKP